MHATQFSRTPSDYRHCDGGHSRRRRDDREIPDGVIAEAIAEGEIEVTPDDHHKGYAKLRTTFIGYDIYVVIDPDDGAVVSCFGSDAWKEAGL